MNQLTAKYPGNIASQLLYPLLVN